MSLRPPRQGRERLSAASVVHGELPNLVALFHQWVDIAGTGKRKVDGELAETRLGRPATQRWANERFRQVMLLIRQFRIEWPEQTLLTADDTEFVRMAIDIALSTAAREDHVADIYDLNPTTWAIWMVQHAYALRVGSWTVESVEAQRVLSFENLYAWLAEQHARGDSFNVRDVAYERGVRRYKLPFKRMTVPPKSNELFKWRRGANRLSGGMERGGLAPIDQGICNVQPPELVAAPPLKAQRESARAKMWDRVAARARARTLTSIEGEGEDARRTRGVVGSVMEASRADAPAMSDADAEELERDLEAALESQQAAPGDADPTSAPPPGAVVINLVSDDEDEEAHALLPPDPTRRDGLYIAPSQVPVESGPSAGSALQEPGLFTSNAIPAGAFVCFYTGTFYSNDEFESLPPARRDALSKYAVEVENHDVTLAPATDETGAVDFTRHAAAAANEPSASGDANAFSQAMVVELLIGPDAELRSYLVVCIFTCRAVAAGDEILWNYGEGYQPQREQAGYAAGERCPEALIRSVQMASPRRRVQSILEDGGRVADTVHEITLTSASEGDDDEWLPTRGRVRRRRQRTA